MTSKNTKTADKPADLPAADVDTTPASPVAGVGGGLGLTVLSTKPTLPRAGGPRKVYKAELLDALRQSMDQGISFALPYLALGDNVKRARNELHSHAEHAGLSVAIVEDGDNLSFYARKRITRKKGDKVTPPPSGQPDATPSTTTES